MATIIVSNTASLAAALKGAVGGDTIKLMPGTYSDLTFKTPNTFNSQVTITSADPTKPAVITDFSLTGWKGLTFTQVEMRALDHPDLIANDGSYVAFKFMECNDIVFDRVKVHGSLDDNPGNDVSGISFRDGNNLTITNSEFQQLERAILVGGAENVKITGNNIHDLRSDGADFVQVKNVLVSNNTFSDFYPAVGDHPDAIQFWTTHATKASTDITISKNVILRGDGTDVQGIFLRDQQGTLPYERVVISDNFISGTGYNGIRIQGAKDIKLTNNELVTFQGQNKTFFLVQGGNGVVASGNKAVDISFGDSVGVTATGNAVTTAVEDFGANALQKLIAANGTRDGLLSTALNDAMADAKAYGLARPEHQTLIGDAKANTLTGGNGNDTLDGRGGDDVLVGGAGNDTYIVPNSSPQIVENAGGGIDTVIAKGAQVLGANVENLVFSLDDKGWRGTGNELDNRIVGNAGGNAFSGMGGNDTLDGGAGGDTLTGGAGQDYLVGGTGADRFVFAPGSGKDIIADFGAGSDADTLDILMFLKAGLKPTIAEVGGNAVISFTNGDSITLQGVHASELPTMGSTGWVF